MTDANISIGHDGDSNPVSTTSGAGASYYSSNSTIVVHPDDTTNSPSVTVEIDATGAEVDDRISYQITAENGGSLQASFLTYEESSQKITNGQGDLADDIYAGETLTLDAGSTDSTIRVYEDNTDSSNGYDRVSTIKTLYSDVWNYDTSDLNGDYVVTFNSKDPSNDGQSFTVLPLNLGVEATDGNITTEDDVTVDVTSEDGGASVTVELYEEGADFSNTDDLANVTVTTGPSGDATANLGNISAIEDQGAGDYVVRAVHSSTGIDATTNTINVTAAGDATVNLPSDTVYEERGDIATLNVSVENTDEAYVKIGSTSSNYALNFTAHDGNDDGYVVVKFNTAKTDDVVTSNLTEAVYAAGNNDDEITTEGDNTNRPQGVYAYDSSGNWNIVTNDAPLSTPIASGNYDVVAGVSDDSRDTKTILSLNKPSVDSVDTWVHQSTNNLPDSDELSELVNGVSQDDTVAAGDILVVEAKASGVFGYVDEKSDFGDARTGNSGVFLNLTQTNEGPNANADELSASDANQVYFDETNNTIYFAYKTGSNTNLNGGEDFKADFHVQKHNAVYKKSQNASAQLSVAEESIEVTGLNSSDVLELEAGANATVAGTSNLAPGTSVDVEIETSGTLFTKTVDVSKNGTFTAQFDLSQLSAGDSVTVTAEGTDASHEVDGMIVENVQETTTTTEGGETSTTTTTTEETTTTTTTTEETTTETTTEETTTVETTTGDNTGSIPGFGAAVSLVALVAAALLALRRSN
ncbi:BGTF surface domain-containing protein [Halorussus sp. AFM4]|uniref:BGTF surface domain-containing protein n=1 Tax=Halorussus sp. AFM4 TaxID=3421651 RepID=UPI003EB7F831